MEVKKSSVLGRRKLLISRFVNLFTVSVKRLSANICISPSGSGAVMK